MGRAHALVGLHGSGLTHLLHLPAHASAFEIPLPLDSTRATLAESEASHHQHHQHHQHHHGHAHEHAHVGLAVVDFFPTLAKAAGVRHFTTGSTHYTPYTPPTLQHSDSDLDSDPDLDIGSDIGSDIDENHNDRNNSSRAPNVPLNISPTVSPLEPTPAQQTAAAVAAASRMKPSPTPTALRMAVWLDNTRHVCRAVETEVREQGRRRRRRKKRREYGKGGKKGGGDAKAEEGA